MIRRVVPDLEPAIALEADGTLNYLGILEESEDLQEWRIVIPQPAQGGPLSYDKSHRFLRSVRR